MPELRYWESPSANGSLSFSLSSRINQVRTKHRSEKLDACHAKSTANRLRSASEQ